MLDEMPMDRDAERFLVDAFEESTVTGRGWDRIRRIARTVADLDASESVTKAHVAEAVGFRQEIS